jgi:hypothetical protein
LISLGVAITSLWRRAFLVAGVASLVAVVAAAYAYVRLTAAYKVSGQPPAYFKEDLQNARSLWLGGALITSLVCLISCATLAAGRRLPRLVFVGVATLVLLLAAPLSIVLISSTSELFRPSFDLPFQVCLLLPPSLVWGSALLVILSSIVTVVYTSPSRHA